MFGEWKYRPCQPGKGSITRSLWVSTKGMAASRLKDSSASFANPNAAPRMARLFSLRADRSGGGPVGAAHALEVHLEEADRVLARRDAVAHLVPRTILDHRGVADR